MVKALFLLHVPANILIELARKPDAQHRLSA